MTGPERTSWRRRVPPLTWVGLAFVVLGLVVRDRWAFYAGGALLVLATLQWGRGAA